MIRDGYLDIEKRPHKWSGAFQASFHSTNSSFILISCLTTLRDLTYLLHEVGHAGHSSISFREPLFLLRRAPRELEELVAITLELIGMIHLDVPPLRDKLPLIRKAQLSQILFRLTSIARRDSFEIWLYSNPSHTWREREEMWNGVYERFSGETPTKQGWLYDEALFRSPFYSTEYAIAQLGALNLYKSYLNDRPETLARMERILETGGRCPFNESFSALGINPFPAPGEIKILIDTFAKSFNLCPSSSSGI